MPCSTVIAATPGSASRSMPAGGDERDLRHRRGARAELSGRPLGDDHAALDDRHPVGELLRLLEVVRREEDRLAEVAQAGDDRPGGAARRRIEARRRLVEEDQLGIADKREADVQAAALAARQAPRALVGLLLQAHERDDLRDRSWPRVVGRPQLERLAHREVGLRAALLQDHPDPRAPGAIAAGGVDAEHAHVAAVAPAKALEDLDRRRLPGAVGPEEGEDLAAAHVQRQPAYRPRDVVRRSAPATTRGRSPRIALAQPVDLDREFAGRAVVGHARPPATVSRPARWRRRRRAATPPAPCARRSTARARTRCPPPR